MGIIRYNESKREQKQASLIGSSGFGSGVGELGIYALAKRFAALTGLNTRTKTNALHISLNFSPKDQLDDRRLLQVAEAYMERIGFHSQPFLVYRHFDAGHPHIHVVTTNIDRNGKRLETHNLGKTKSEEARRSLEKEFGLTPAESQSLVTVDLKTLLNPRYGSVPTKKGINAVLIHVLANYCFASLAEFNAVLQAYHVAAYRGEPDSLRYKKGGLVYHFLDEKGGRLGVPLKASSFHAKPTLKNLEKRYGSALYKKNVHREAVTAKISSSLESKSATGEEGLEQWKLSLKRAGIHVSILRNAQGLLYGITYVDHRSGCVFKGSDLDKRLGASGIRSAFFLPAPGPKTGMAPERAVRHSGDLPSPGYFFDMTMDILRSVGTDSSDTPFQGGMPPKQKKKRRKKGSTNEQNG